MPPDMQLMPYAKNDQIWKCPSDSAKRQNPNNVPWWDGNYRAKALLRSYAYVGEIHTREANGRDVNTGVFKRVGPGQWDMAGRKNSELDETSNTVAWVEQWSISVDDQYVGGIWGSGFINCDTAKLAGRNVPAKGPADQGPPGCDSWYAGKPTPGHRSKGHYVFCDGSAGIRTWNAARASDFRIFKARKPETEFVP
jgi:hypothetical protein